MEHLSLPAGATIEATEKTPLVAVQYDKGPFLTYPDRHPDGALFYRLRPDVMTYMIHDGFSEEEVRRLESFLQTWLCFGLMHEFMGDMVVMEEFIDRSGTATILNTSRLCSLLTEWSAKIRPNVQKHAHFSACLRRAWHVLSVKNLHGDININPIVILSLATIGEALRTVVIKAVAPQATIEGTGLWAAWSAFKSLLQRRMITNGWCPVDNSRWQSQITGLEGAIYLSKLRLPTVQDHTQCQGHDVCLRTQHNLAPDVVSLHVCPTGGCDTVGIDILAVQAIIDAGADALIEVDTSSADIKIKVVASNQGHPYVAISHVWAEGLGNPSANALPSCQLRALANTFEQFRQDTGEMQLYIWLDTLCCPVLSSKHRQICISRMSRIYSEAKHVLVISSSFRSLESTKMDAVEMLMRFVCSAWCTRLWTLQEGAMARRLWVQFANGAIDMDDLEKIVDAQARSTWQHAFLHISVLTAYRQIRRLLEIRPATEVEHKSMLSLIQAVQARAVTIPTDEPICLFTCMSIDQQVLMTCPPDKRMRAFWEAMGKAKRAIPYSYVLFTGPRLQDIGFRWAPASLMRSTRFWRTVSDRSAEVFGFIYNVGLMCNASAAQISAPRDMLYRDAAFWAAILQEQRIPCAIRIRENHWRPLVYDSAARDHQLDLLLFETYRSEKGVVLILEDKDLDTARPALLATRILVEGDGIQVRCLGTVFTEQPDEKFSLFLERVYQLSRDPEILALLPCLEGWSHEHDVSHISDDMLGEKALSRLPAMLSDKLRSVAKIALQDPELQACLPANRAQNVSDFATALIYGLAGRLLVVDRTWSRDQCWALD